ncbi:MAG: hypothetical protein GX558_04225, partial [Clostridiales bacterium]|nr:hypothetical protein [Clostridiales bacterium]
RTVLGDRPAAGGHWQCHEHIFLAKGQSFAVNPALLMDDYGASARELIAYRDAGGSGMVDAQPGGCGRMAAELARASEETGVAIVASTGYHKLCFYPEGHWIFDWDQGALAELWAGEVELGMFASMDAGAPRDRLPCRAGVVKVAVDSDGVAGRYRALLSAAADAAARSGAGMLCHVEAGADPMAVLDLVGGRGVAPDRVILCHLDRANPASAPIAAREGAFVEFDTIARYKYHGDDAEIAQILAMLDGGWADRLLLSLDTTNRRLAAYGGEIGLSYLLTTFFAQLRRSGVTEAALHQIARVNPGVALALA